MGSIGDKFRMLRVTTEVMYEAGLLTQKHPLKGYDAVQLATALRFSRVIQAYGLTPVFVSGDKKLVKAAQSEGMAAENPFDHTDMDEQPGHLNLT